MSEESREDRFTTDVVTVLHLAGCDIKREQANTESRLDKRSLAIALTHLETTQLWLANSRPE